MRNFFVGIAIAFSITACSGSFPTTPQGRLDEAAKSLVSAQSDEDRFYALGDAAMQSFELGKVEDAKQYADELLTLAPKFTKNWNYGNAIHNGHVVLGRIAVKEGRIEEAKQHLLDAGATPGSPQLDSFGPNMSLAKDLIEKGERDAVIAYFELCKKFWEMHGGQLDDWSASTKAGNVPAFGANLVY